MIVICSWCKEVIGVKEGNEGLVSHGICEKCLAVEMEKILPLPPPIDE